MGVGLPLVLAMATSLFITWSPPCGSTSPWRLPHGQLQDAFQRPTLRTRTPAPFDTGQEQQSGVASNSVISPKASSSSSSSEEPSDGNKSYKTFYRVFYGTPPPPDSQADSRVQEHRINSEHQQQEHRTSAGHDTQVLEDIRAANEHFLHVRTNFRCGVPSPRVFRVQDLYRDTSREYLPRCAVLHRCGDDVGCCDNEAFHCAPSAVQEVALTFYVLSVSTDPDSPGLSSSLEKLLFENHTECQCRLLGDMPRSAINGGGAFKDHRQSPATTAAPSTTTTTTTTTPPMVVGPSAGEENTLRPSRCRECPVPFHSRQYPDGRCSCDCFDRDKPCLKVKRGKDPLDEVERRCVEVSHCHLPECDYGAYDYDSGKCPKRPENYRRPPADGRGQVSPAHRWNYLERD